MLKYLVGVGLILGLSQCFKEEVPIELPQFGTDSRIETIEMGPDYAGQYFFDLGTGQIIASNDKTDWDLAFSCEKGNFLIWLNSSKTMMVAKAPTNDFDRGIHLSDLEWNFDGASGSADSNAIGEWGDFSMLEPASLKEVLVLDRGEDPFGKHLGYRKIQLLNFKENTYRFQMADLDGRNGGVFSILKDDLYNYIYFSLKSDDPGTVDIAPYKVDWDLQITRYTTRFYAPSLLPYQVTGAIINYYKVEAAVIEDIGFNEVSLDHISGLNFSTAWDVVGFNWKTVDINSGLFSVKVDRVYVIKDVAGDYYKLRFIDFYNHLGEKGFPKFEYMRL